MNFIKRFFGWRRRVEPETDETSDLSSIKYSITKEGDVEIHIEWSDGSPETAEWLGEIIAAIHSGTLDESVLEILLGHAENNPEDLVFVNKAINSWASVAIKLIEQHPLGLGNEAVVSPSQVFGVNKTNA